MSSLPLQHTQPQPIWWPGPAPQQRRHAAAQGAADAVQAALLESRAHVGGVSVTIIGIPNACRDILGIPCGAGCPVAGLPALLDACSSALGPSLTVLHLKHVAKQALPRRLCPHFWAPCMCTWPTWPHPWPSPTFLHPMHVAPPLAVPTLLHPMHVAPPLWLGRPPGGAVQAGLGQQAGGGRELGGEVGCGHAALLRAGGRLSNGLCALQ